MISDDFVGLGTVTTKGKSKPTVVSLKLYGKGKEKKGGEKESKKSGKLYVEIQSSENLKKF